MGARVCCGVVSPHRTSCCSPCYLPDHDCNRLRWWFTCRDWQRISAIKEFNMSLAYYKEFAQELPPALYCWGLGELYKRMEWGRYIQLCQLFPLLTHNFTLLDSAISHGRDMDTVMGWSPKEILREEEGTLIHNSTVDPTDYPLCLRMDE